LNPKLFCSVLWGIYKDLMNIEFICLKTLSYTKESQCHCFSTPPSSEKIVNLTITKTEFDLLSLFPSWRFKTKFSDQLVTVPAVFSYAWKLELTVVILLLPLTVLSPSCSKLEIQSFLDSYKSYGVALCTKSKSAFLESNYTTGSVLTSRKIWSTLILFIPPPNRLYNNQGWLFCRLNS
jgi:hypothetical protein